MTTQHTAPNAVDHLRYVFAEVTPLLEAAADTLAGNCYEMHRPAEQHAADLDHVLELLDSCRKTIFEAVADCTADRDDMETYADGRPVNTTLELEEGCYFTYQWQPRPEHPNNQPRELCVTELRDGTRKRILVTAPGILDAVPVRPHLRAIDGGAE